ncbi:MAG TPA: glucosamine-6-phosphate deaminase [Vicinamibacterales bacterium]
MRLRIYSNEDLLARALARRVASRLAAQPRLVLGLATGRTPLPLYRELAALHAAGRTDYRRATSFNLDEFVGLDRNHPGSYRSYMQEHLFRHINLPASRAHFLDGQAPDLEAECERFEQAIIDAGGIDLQILGIGTNGHIGFNEPAPRLWPWSHRVKLTAGSRRANAGFFGGDVRKVPREALSMGVATILKARSIVLIATGSRKAAVVARMAAGPITTSVPASLLQLHHDVEVWLDEPAAAKLRQLGVVEEGRREAALHERRKNR